MARRGRLCHRQQATREGQSGRVALLECPYESRHSSRDVRGTPNVVFPSSFPHTRRVAYGQPVPVACAWLLLLSSLRRAAVDWPRIQTSHGHPTFAGSGDGDLCGAAAAPPWTDRPDPARRRRAAGHNETVRSGLGVWRLLSECRAAAGADGGLVASGGLDGTVKLWETASCTLMCTLRSDRRFERMDISRLTGVTQEQRSVLLALGAVEA